MNRPQRDSNFLEAMRGLVQPAPVDMAPLEQLEAKANESGFVEAGSLCVWRRKEDLRYFWGDAEISRTEAARRAIGRAS
jgi:hypothetical protein